ncbi:hypothetical protein VB636_21990, partial [Paracoccus sp. APAP_BH8]
MTKRMDAAGQHDASPSGGLAYIRILEYALLRRAICVQEEYSMRHAPTSAAGPVSTPDLDLD